MVLMNGNTIIDDRPCIGTYDNSLDGYAYMVNPDYSIERMHYANHDRGEYYFTPKVDADHDTIRKARARNLIGNSGAYAQIGDTVTVSKGRKYPNGMKIKVARTYTYTAPDRSDIPYIEGTEGERISAYNTWIIDVGDSTRYYVKG